jgi:hypothetical protein
MQYECWIQRNAASHFNGMPPPARLSIRAFRHRMQPEGTTADMVYNLVTDEVGITLSGATT